MAVKSKTKLNARQFRFLGFFLIGTGLGLVLLILGFFLLFELKYHDKIYPGVKVNNIDVGDKKKSQVKNYFVSQNSSFADFTFTFKFLSEDKNLIATASGAQLQVGYNSQLLADQAFLIGRSGSFATALYQKWQARKGEINLPASFSLNQEELEKFIDKLAKQIDIPAQEALFQFASNRVVTFRPSLEGQAVDRKKAIEDFKKLISPPSSGTIDLTIFPVEPKVKTNEANNLGIKEMISEGKSFFQGSIANRIYNISLAASRINGQLIPPGEIFSFNQAVGEISAETGYKQAYIIKEKRTVLDDGGGVCQVSTTFFRAALNAGLPIVERQAHAYRVAYYEQGDFGPGLDATVYAPRVDLKIKNDTPAYILIQATVDSKKKALFIDLYGTADGRTVILSKAKITDQVAPPPDLYQDDPTLPKGEIKQVDFPAWGARVAFDWQVTRGLATLQKKTFYSNYQPWQAIYLRGTKE
ncbi:MAG: VanW family protein [Patescibacteria group bacterium]|nr:VanW family protein [Patescibacteria group bacterium]